MLDRSRVLLLLYNYCCFIIIAIVTAMMIITTITIIQRVPRGFRMGSACMDYNLYKITNDRRKQTERDSQAFDYKSVRISSKLGR